MGSARHMHRAPIRVCRSLSCSRPCDRANPARCGCWFRIPVSVWRSCAAASGKWLVFASEQFALHGMQPPQWRSRVGDDDLVGRCVGSGRCAPMRTRTAIPARTPPRGTCAQKHAVSRLSRILVPSPADEFSTAIRADSQAQDEASPGVEPHGLCRPSLPV